MRSIQSRLGLGLAASLIAVFALQWLVVSVTMRHLSENGMVAHMEHDMDNLLAGLSFDTAGRLHLAPGRIEQVYQKTFSGNYFRIVSGDQVMRSRSLWDEDLPAAPAAAGKTAVQRLTGPQSQPLLMRTRAFELQGRGVSISVAQDLTPLENDIRHFRNRYALVSAVALLLLLVMQAYLVRQDLRPLRTAREDLRRLERGEISALGEDVPQELQPLVRELNQLLAAMHRRLARSRQALGNLAHALKTPLTLLTHQVGHEKIRAEPDLQRDMTAQLRAINRLIERELKRARLSGAALPGQRFDFSAEIPPLVTTLASLYREKRLDIATRLPDKAVLSADREDMLELLGNLLDNACKWGKHRVLIEVACVPGSITIKVHDDGPGCPPESLAWLAQRGARLDESAPGHGLGLAIALDIAADYGGRIGFGRSEALGGFLVTADLKSASS